MRVGIIGGGQLGRMLALAGHDLGQPCTTLDPEKDSPASQVAPALLGAYDDREALLELAARSDVITYEFENVPTASAALLEACGSAVFPPAVSLETAQDRLAEKTLFTEVGLPVSSFAGVHDLDSLHEAIAAIGLPAVLKTRRLGYDGKGQAVLHHAELALEAWRAVGEVPSILEAFVPFEREVSIVAVRARDGEVRSWPLVANVHRAGILRTSVAPAPDIASDLRKTAERHVRAVAERLEHVGVLTIELFVHEGTLLGNEMAPRVHNSGHWTIEGSETSQFENHLRAVCGLPLGPTDMVGAAAMVNLIGIVPDEASLLAVPGAHLHLYGKEPRPGRKLGHVTVRADDAEVLHDRLAQVTSLVTDG